MNSRRIGGYHCWAHFHVNGHGWVPGDIFATDQRPETKNHCYRNLAENRVTFSTGRDITLVPTSTGGPLNCFIDPHVNCFIDPHVNCFIDPHVEVIGRAWPPEKNKLSFASADKPSE